MEIKTLKQLRKGNLNVPFILMEEKIRQEAIKRVNSCVVDVSPDCKCWAVIVEVKCNGCKREVWVNDLTEEDLNPTLVQPKAKEEKQ